MKILQAPLSENDVRSLRLGEVVNLSGPVITGRDEMHIRALKYAKDGKDVPSEINGSVLYHCGPIMKKDGDSWEVVSAGPTTSARMNSLEAEMISTFSIRAIIGKGGMSTEISEVMKNSGCVYLAATGGAAVTLAEGLSSVIGVEWLDLGMPEALWKFNASRLGPLVVAMDAEGNSLYEAVKRSLKR